MTSFFHIFFLFKITFFYRTGSNRKINDFPGSRPIISVLCLTSYGFSWDGWQTGYLLNRTARFSGPLGKLTGSSLLRINPSNFFSPANSPLSFSFLSPRQFFLCKLIEFSRINNTILKPSSSTFRFLSPHLTLVLLNPSPIFLLITFLFRVFLRYWVFESHFPHYSSCYRVKMFCRSFNDFDNDPLTWSRDLFRHQTGEVSMAAVHANEAMEDFCQVEVGPDNSLFIGIYDGHGGVEASEYISQNIFQNLLRRLRQNNRYTPLDVFPQVFSDVEAGFMRNVYRNFCQQPTIASVGSCCLVGVIWRGSLEIANLGDSRAILGSTGFGTTKRVRAVQLTEDHHCSSERIRSGLKLEHCHDPHIVIESHGAWRVKGVSKVTRTIGDSYLKLNPFSYSGKYPRPSAVRGLLTQPVLSAEPGLNSMVIGKYDKFVIFASHGFWEFISNEEAISMVEGNGRHGIAKRLLWTALRRAARDGSSRYSVLLGVAQGRGGRRRFHDDMTVIVVFLDERRWWWRWRQVPEMSYRGFSETVVATRFTEQPLDLGEEHSSRGLETPPPLLQPSSPPSQQLRNCLRRFYFSLAIAIHVAVIGMAYLIVTRD